MEKLELYNQMFHIILTKDKYIEDEDTMHSKGKGFSNFSTSLVLSAGFSY